MFSVYLIIILLSLLELANAGYLEYSHRKDKRLMCPLGEDCNTVANSKWSELFGIRNSTLGILYYAALIIAMLVALAAPAFSAQILFFSKIAAAVALLISIFLTFIQIFVIKNYCSYCIMSAVINLLIFIVLI